MMVARVIKAVGNEELQADILPRVLRGEATIALGMSEPEAGSDVAAVTTRARPAEGGWMIDGQKMFTTNGHIADYVFLLARTDPDEQASPWSDDLSGPAAHRGLRGPRRIHRFGRTDQHHLLQRAVPRRPLAHQ